MKAIETSPKDIINIETPLNGSGTLETEILSLIELIANNISENPIADPSP